MAAACCKVCQSLAEPITTPTRGQGSFKASLSGGLDSQALNCRRRSTI